MKPYYEDLHIKIYNKDCRSMDELPDESVQCVVTSPPYFGLRKYAGEQDLIWGGDENCRHKWQEVIKPASSGSNVRCGVSIDTQASAATKEKQTSGLCSLCGAWRGALGLEPTPELYIQHLIEILREIRRVLRKDGVVFWNIGDSYVGGKGQSGVKSQEYQDARVAKGLSLNRVQQTGGPGETRALDDLKALRASGLKPKDLCLVPFRVAIAAQEDGWWARSVIIWSKPNPMPESVTDRPTESHEYILMLTKSARYYWDQEAVREEYTEPLNRWGGPEFRESSHKYIELGGHDGQQKYGATSMFRKGRPVRPIESGRNLRSVWEFPTKGFPEAHFAVFPEKLPELCIKAASKEGDLILDPLMGAGTTLLVAKKLNRYAVGYELSEEYCQLAVERCRQQVLL